MLEHESLFEADRTRRLFKFGSCKLPTLGQIHLGSSICFSLTLINFDPLDSSLSELEASTCFTLILFSSSPPNGASWSISIADGQMPSARALCASFFRRCVTHFDRSKSIKQISRDATEEKVLRSYCEKGNKVNITETITLLPISWFTAWPWPWSCFIQYQQFSYFLLQRASFSLGTIAMIHQLRFKFQHCTQLSRLRHDFEHSSPLTLL